MNATVETRHDCGAVQTIRGEDGRRWRVAADAADGTLAVEQIEDYGGGRAICEIEDMEAGDCAVARWNLDGTLSLFVVRDCGDNHTDPKEYEDGNDVWVATRSGWVQREEAV